MSDETAAKSEATKPGREFTFDWLNRRIHLYLALALLPWFLVYGISAILLSHPNWFEQGPPNTVLFEREYQLEPIPADADLNPIREKIQKDVGLEGFFLIYRHPNGSLSLWSPGFMRSTEITYDAAKHTLKAGQNVVRVARTLIALHTRGGFENPGLLQQAWGVIVDLVQVGLILWLVSGFVMWWKIKRYRLWGLLATAAGMISFVIFMAGL